MPITKKQRQRAIAENICLDCKIPQKSVTVNEKGFCPRHDAERQQWRKKLHTSSIQS